MIFCLFRVVIASRYFRLHIIVIGGIARFGHINEYMQYCGMSSTVNSTDRSVDKCLLCSFLFFVGENRLKTSIGTVYKANRIWHLDHRYHNYESPAAINAHTHTHTHTRSLDNSARQGRSTKTPMAWTCRENS